MLVLVCEIQKSAQRTLVLTYLQTLPQQSVSSKTNLQVVDKFRKTCELFLCSKSPPLFFEHKNSSHVFRNLSTILTINDDRSISSKNACK